MSGADRVRLHAGPTILPTRATALAAKVMVRRRVQQTNTRRTSLEAFRLTLSGLAPLV